MSTAPRRLMHRPRRVIPATVLAVVLILLGLLGAWVLGVLALTGQWPQTAQQTMMTAGQETLGSPGAIVLGAVLALAGLVLLIAGLKPGKPSRTAITASDGAEGETVLPNRDVARWVRTSVQRVDGVQGAQVKASRRRVRIDVTSPVDDRSTVQDACTTAAQQALSELRLSPAPRTAVTVDRGS